MEESDLDERSFLFKIIVIGEPNVGKTSLIRRFCQGHFTTTYKSTIGVDFLQKEIKWDKWTDVNLHFWDIAGQERIGSQVNIFFRDTHGVICLYDVTDEKSKAQVASWKKLINEKLTMHGKPYKPPSILVANKIDKICEKSHDFDTEEINALAEQLEFDVAFPMSIKGNYNLENMMENLMRLMIKADANIDYDQEEQEFIQLEKFADDRLGNYTSYCSKC